MIRVKEIQKVGLDFRFMRSGESRNMELIRDRQEMWQTLCVMDVTLICSDETLVINDVEFHPFEKICEMRDGTLGLLTGMTLDELKKEQVKSLLAEKIVEHLRDLSRRGFDVMIVHKDWITIYDHGHYLNIQRG